MLQNRPDYLKLRYNSDPVGTGFL